MDLLEDGGQDIQEFGEGERRPLLNSQVMIILNSLAKCITF